MKQKIFRRVLIYLCTVILFLYSNSSLIQAVETEGNPLDDSSSDDVMAGVKVDKEKISLDLKGIDIVELLRILSQKMGLTIVPTKSVSGRVNIYLNNLTFEDALEVILISQDLASERTENIISVMTSAEYEKLYGKKYNEKRKVKSIKLNYAKPAAVYNALGQIKSDIGKLISDEATGTMVLIDIPEKLELMEKTARDLDQPLQTEVFDIKYAKSADVKTVLSTAITTGPGEVYIDERSGKAVVSDLSEKMKKIRRIVKAFDEPTRQVYIEAEILQITLKDEYQRSISWEKIFREKAWNDLDFKGTFPIATSFTPSPLLSANAMQVAVGILGKHNYTSTLKLLSTLGDTKVLSQPKITVANNQEAKIMVGSREAYVTQTLSQAETTTVTSESVQFVDVGVKLNVVPTINTDGYVTMKIKPEVSSVRETLTTAVGSTIPIVETSEAETVVKVKDGAIIMIAGLMKEEKRQDITGLPFLSRIPIIGAAFGARDRLNKRTELIVFITPHVISGDVTVAGTEPEKTMPAAVVSESMKKDIMSRKIEELKMKPKAKEPAEEDIQSEMKGVKQY